MSTKDEIDAEPRSYPEGVSLLRRSSLYAHADATSFQTAIDDWLLGKCLVKDDLLFLFEEFAWRLVHAGLPLDRTSLHVGTLHPQLYGFGWHWERGDLFCDEVKIEEAATVSNAYRKNPLFHVINTGEIFQSLLSDEEAVARYPLLTDLKKAGYSEYIVLPLRAGGRYHNAITLATKADGGFSPAERQELQALIRIFALHVERHIALKLSSNLAATYLGNEAGERVLQGSIHRGDGLMYDAIIWVSDMRNFTGLSERLQPEFVSKVLNAYFEIIVDIVTQNGGEVLKFIGDGLLAVFPYDHFDSRKRAANAAIQSATETLKRLEIFNSSDHEALKDSDIWRPIKIGIGLHEGNVFFGNIGGKLRLDFTVIGQAVNAASRIEGMTKVLGRPLLMSSNVAELLDQPLVDHGSHQLKGVEQSMTLFSLEEATAD